MEKNKLWDGMVDNTNKTLTENGAVTLKSTKSAVLDLFSMGGALRKRNVKDIELMISKALAEDFELGLKCLFYLRDIREGVGERRVFRIGLKVLSELYPTEVNKIVPLISEYGRWDDILYLKDVKIRDYLNEQLIEDLTSDFPSLLGKWLPSINSSQKTRVIALKLAEYLGHDKRNYRQMLSILRKKIGILETKISNGEYKSIDYSKLPSKAHMNYRKAFLRNDKVRYEKYLESVSEGTAKINSGTLFPYEILRAYDESSRIDNTLEEQWKALPNYIREDDTGLVVADVSGSMYGLPLNVSISLALYFAERNKGPFAGKYISFASRPALLEPKGNTLLQKIKYVKNTDVGYSTNIQAVFNLILKTAIEKELTQKDMPSTIYIVSDMEFNECSRTKTNFEFIKEKFEECGYTMPTLVFWNVDSRQNNVPVKQDENGVILVSGCSPTVFKMVMNKTTPYEFMINTLGLKRYDAISEAIK